MKYTATKISLAVLALLNGDASAASCLDASGSFNTTHFATGEVVTANCGNWLTKNLKWRCNNFPGVSTNCCASCEFISSPPTTDPDATLSPTLSDASPSPTEDDCADFTGRIKIESVELRGKTGRMRSCAWAARTDTFWRCDTITEISENCPDTCGACTTQ